MRNSFSVKTVLRKDKCKADNKNRHPLYYQIIFRRGKTQLPVGKYIDTSHWDDKKRCVKDGLLKNILIKEENRIYNLLLEMENNGEDFTKDTVKAKIKGIEKEKINPDFHYHYKEFVKNKFAIDDLADGTKEHYLLLGRRLKSFKPKLRLDEINTKFVDDFVYHMKVDLEIGNAGINSRIKNLNTVLRKLVIDKTIPENPCIHYKKFPESSKVIFLNPDELKRLIEADLKFGNLTKGLEKTRKLFLFSCYTGLRDCDIKTLKKNNIVDNLKIVKNQIKTKDEVTIPFNKYWFDIIKEAGFERKKRDELVFNNVSNKTLNVHIKIIGRLSKINKKMSFHVGRHTFGSLLALQGVPIHLIAKYMGHKSIKTTQIYMNSDEVTATNVMKNVKF